MNADEVMKVLHARFADSDYVKIEQAPTDSSRMGRKIDLVAIHCWKSRGYAVDAVEVKVTYSDWKKERDNAAKADFWWTHSNRFWIAAPADLAKRIKPELPEGWGLLSIQPDRCTAVVEAPRRTSAPLSVTTWVGLLRASVNAGFSALQRAESRGYERGRAAPRGAADAVLREQFDALKATVAAAEEASGIPLVKWPNRQEWGQATHEEILEAVSDLADRRSAIRVAEERLAALTERARAVLQILDPEYDP